MCGSCGGNNKTYGITAPQTREDVELKREPVGISKFDECCKQRQIQQNSCNDELKASRQQAYRERAQCIGDYEQHLFETPDEDICEKGPRDPYHIPGYAGHVPSLQARSGHTYGQDTHEVLASQNGHPAASYSKGSHTCPEPMHEPYRIPGYTGHVPGLKSMVGGTYGGDTHKLLYHVESYPNRQENLSLYRPNQGNYNWNGGTENRSFSGLSNGHSNDSYQRPKEHYYKPQYKYRIADTHATRADLTLVDPCVNEESKVVVSTRELDDTQVVRTQDCLEEKVEPAPYINKPLRHRPMVPGFDTYIDAMRGARGQRFELTASSPSHQKLQQQIVLQKGKVRDFPNDEGHKVGGNGTPPPGQDNRDELPFGYAKYGGRQRYTNSALYDFTSNYRRRMSSEWAPAGISRPDPPAFDVPGEIYNEHMGLLPGYTAHVPGAMFRCGKTFTDDSRDARRALRGDRL